jgi:dipeptidyl aminopeptidase/acylaminoacyl peptidase
MEAYTIDSLRARAYPGGEIKVWWVYTTTASFTRYLIAYPSDDLTITGVMCVPHGEGPFPVVIMNHGYIAPSEYWSGEDTWVPAEFLAERGYLTIAPDFRGWGQSDFGPNFLRTGLVIDALNLTSSLPSLPEADPERVGMWGHSMGGGAAAKAIVIDGRIKAAVLYAPVSADDWQVWQTWGPWVVDYAYVDPFLEVERNAWADPHFMRRMSALYYMDRVTAAVQIHQGLKDTVTPPEWSAAIRDALRQAGKPVEYYAYEGQGHAFVAPDWRLFMTRVARFFDQHLK